jgi:hypothetical protein
MRFSNNLEDKMTKIAQASLWLLSGIFCWLLLPMSAGAQQFPRLELFAGFSYSNFNLGPQTAAFAPTGHNYYGGDVTLSVNPKRYLRLLLFDIGAQQGHSVFSEGIGNAQVLFGPQFVLRRPRVNVFAHTLFGLTNTHLGGCGFGGPCTVHRQNRTNFALGFGGGVDLNLSRRFAVRLVQTDFIPARLAGQWENNFRISTGVVLRFAYTQAP